LLVELDGEQYGEVVGALLGAINSGELHPERGVRAAY
jgi:hypothetical protein